MSSPYGDRSGDALARRSVEIEVLMEVPAEELKELRPAVSWSLAYHERDRQIGLTTRDARALLLCPGLCSRIGVRQTPRRLDAAHLRASADRHV
jgi:hypothetical protein